MKIKKIFLVRVLSLCIGFVWMNGLVFGQSDGINWMTWEEVDQQSKIERKKILAIVYTPWCEVCKKMKYLTLKDSVVCKYINNNFYPIYFNAETTENIEINGKTYRSKGRYNELAIEITMGRLSFPTLVFIDENFKILQPLAGYLKADKLEPILNYYAGNHYKNTPWRIFENWYSMQNDKLINPTQIKGKN